MQIKTGNRYFQTKILLSSIIRKGAALPENRRSIVPERGEPALQGCRLKGEEMVTAFISVVNCRLLCF